MNRTRISSSKVRRRVAAAIAAIGVLAGGVATAGASNAAFNPAYGPEPTDPAEAAGVAAATETTTAATEDTAAVTEATADPNALVHMAETSLGTILVDQEGFTLYAFLNDTDGESTCTGDCLANWPAVVVEGELNVGNLDPAQFSTVENPEAGPMLKMGDWPLYRFAGDAAPGDMNGQGVGEVWYVVGPLGVPASLVNTRETSVLDPALWSTVENPEAGAMLKIGDWPLYTFTPDAAPGDVNGQGVGEVWYAVAPDGTLIEGDITVTEFAPAPAGTAPAGTEPAGTAPATTG
jgi:predicted lipoprotein with Yx(FWY)xxD motif